MNRHHRSIANLLRTVLLAVSAVLAVGLAARPAPGAEPRRPNFIFVYTDDQRWDAMGVVPACGSAGERAAVPLALKTRAEHEDRPWPAKGMPDSLQRLRRQHRSATQAVPAI